MRSPMQSLDTGLFRKKSSTGRLHERQRFNSLSFSIHQQAEAAHRKNKCRGCNYQAKGHCTSRDDSSELAAGEVTLAKHVNRFWPRSWKPLLDPTRGQAAHKRCGD